MHPFNLALFAIINLDPENDEKLARTRVEQVKAVISLIEQCNLRRQQEISELKAILSSIPDLKDTLFEEKEAEISLDVQDNYGHTALMLAVRGNHQEIAHELIKSKCCNPDFQNGNGDTALMGAAYKNHGEIVHELIESKRCNFDLQDKDDYTALIWAAVLNHREIAQELIKAGAKVNIPNKEGKTALDYAIKHENLLIVGLLLTHGAQIRDPSAFLKFLYSCDQRDPDLPDCLEALCRQQRSMREAKLADAKPVLLLEEEYAKAEDYLIKIKKLNVHFSKLAITSVYENANKSDENGILPPILDPIGIMAEYHREGLQFFSPYKVLSVDDVNRISTTIDTQPKKSGCSLK